MQRNPELSDNLIRLHYMDLFLKVKEDMTSEQIENAMIKIKAESEDLSIEDIRKRVCTNWANRFWFYRFKGKISDPKEINKDQFYIERFHHKNIDKILNAGGKRIIDIKDKMERRPLVAKHLDLYDKYLPIVVEKLKEGHYEILVGNHRALSHIAANYTLIPVLQIKRGNHASDIASLSAKLGQRLSCYALPVIRKIRRK